MKKSKANKVKWDMVFIPDQDHNGIPYRESVQWLDQFYDATGQCIKTNRRILLVVGGDNPTEVWSMRNNKHDGTCYLEWKMPNVVVKVNDGVADVTEVDAGIEVIIKDYDAQACDLADGVEYDEDEGCAKLIFGETTGTIDCQVILTCRGGVVDIELCPEDIEVEIQD